MKWRVVHPNLPGVFLHEFDSQLAAELFAQEWCLDDWIVVQVPSEVVA